MPTHIARRTQCLLSLSMCGCSGPRIVSSVAQHHLTGLQLQKECPDIPQYSQPCHVRRRSLLTIRHTQHATHGSYWSEALLQAQAETKERYLDTAAWRLPKRTSSCSLEVVGQKRALRVSNSLRSAHTTHPLYFRGPPGGAPGTMMNGQWAALCPISATDHFASDLITWCGSLRWSTINATGAATRR